MCLYKDPLSLPIDGPHNSLQGLWLDLDNSLMFLTEMLNKKYDVLIYASLT